MRRHLTEEPAGLEMCNAMDHSYWCYLTCKSVRRWHSARMLTRDNPGDLDQVLL